MARHLWQVHLLTSMVAVLEGREADAARAVVAAEAVAAELGDAQVANIINSIAFTDIVMTLPVG
ncbi:MAG: hypothetical protein U1F43_16230 [Myxococcota bacterium]